VKALVSVFIVAGSLCAFAQAGTKQGPISEETKGVCSPIAPDNKGTITITCSGFSDKQNKQIMDFLKQLSSEQAKDQEVLLQKLDQIIATLRATQRPRKITDEAATTILRSNWGFCAQVPIIVVAPSGDDEAGSLAVQLVNLFSRAGRSSRVQYIPEQQTTAKADVIISADRFDLCPLSFMTGSGAVLNFSVSSGTSCDGRPAQPPKDTKISLVYVCHQR